MGVVAPGPSSGYYTCPPCPLPQSRSGNGLGSPFILRSWALPSQGLQALSNSCQLSSYQGPKVSQMASLSPGLSLSPHRAWDSCGMFAGVHTGGHVCTPSAHAAAQAHTEK